MIKLLDRSSKFLLNRQLTCMDNSTITSFASTSHHPPIQSPSQNPSKSVDYAEVIATIHAQRRTAAPFRIAILHKSFIEFWYIFFLLFLLTLIANNYAENFNACAITFKYREDRDHFIAKKADLFPESSAFKL